MGWAKFDDRRHTNKKLNAACAIDPLKGMAANGLDANGLTYSTANETDGFVDDAALVQLIPGGSRKLRADLTSMLVTVDRWTRDDERGGWWIKNYLGFNPAHDDLEKKRAEDAERKRKQRHGEDGRFQAESAGNPNGVHTESTRSHTDPLPSPPDPSHPIPGDNPKSPNNLESVGAQNGGDSAPQLGDGGKLRDLIVNLAAICTANSREAVMREAALVIGLCQPHTPILILERAVAIITPKKPVLPRFLLKEVEKQRRLAGLPAVKLSIDGILKQVPA